MRPQERIWTRASLVCRSGSVAFEANTRGGSSPTISPGGRLVVAEAQRRASVLLTRRTDGGALEIYDATTDTIMRLGTFDHYRYAHSVTRLPNGEVLIADGRNNAVAGFSDPFPRVSR